MSKKIPVIIVGGANTRPIVAVDKMSVSLTFLSWAKKEN
jgi:hypothetical protein